jgi:hypothetical protein
VKNADPAIYKKIEGAFLRRKTDYFHPEYPDELLRERLRRFLPHLCFYVTRNCMLRAVLRGEYLCFEQIVSFGVPSLREVTTLVALGYAQAMRTGCAVILESFARDRHHAIMGLSEQELQFPIINADADDPWDTTESIATDPHLLTANILGELAGEVDVHLAPFYGYVYFEEERRDALDIIAALSARTRVLHVSTNSRGLTQALHQRLSQRSPWRVGAPRVNYISTVPKLDALARWSRRGSRDPVEIHLLVEGELHELA